MAKNDELFILIKSLSRSEKRYFKLFVSGGEHANYLRLFEVIDKQEVYDESSVRQYFSGERFVKQMHVTKNYLRNLLLASLRNFHHAISKDAELKEVLRNVELLFNKELFGLCETELKKAEALAKKYELNTGLVEVLSWKRKLKQAIKPNDYAAFYGFIKEQSGVLAELLNSNLYWKHIVAESWLTFQNRDIAKELKKLPQPNEAGTLESKVLKYNAGYIRNLREGNSSRAEKELWALIAFLEGTPHRIQEDTAPYISTINNLASFLVINKRDDEALELINKAKATYAQFRITTERRSVLKQILRTYSLELELYRGNRQYIRNYTSFIKDTERYMETNRNKIPKEYLLSIWFQLANIYFTDKQYDASLKCLNSILNNKFEGIRPDLRLHARMLNLIVHFEQKNYFVLRYFVDSTRRFIRKFRLLDGYEETLLKFFVKLASLPEYEHRKQYKVLYDKLFPEGKEAGISEDVMDYINYKEWLEMKLKKR